MGKLEKKSAEELRKTQINKAILATIQVAGVMTVAALAPNVISALAKTKLLPQMRYRISGALGRMVEKGYVAVEKVGGKSEIRLTEKGEAFAAMITEGEAKVKKPRKWDKKWRVVVYDLKRVSSAFRARIRTLLRSFGFVLLQNSVWVYPYDCEDLIFILKQEFRLGGSLLYIIADQIENDDKLRKHFGLPAQ